MEKTIIRNKRIANESQRMKKQKAVVIFSGGMDSTTLLYWAKDIYDYLTVITINYGQRHKKEIECAKSICKKLNLEHDIVDISSIKTLLKNNALTDDVKVPEGHFADPIMKSTVVPNRNMLLLSVALCSACVRDADEVLYGAHFGDHAIYPDCRKEFVEALDKASRLCWYKEIKIIAPFVDKNKTDIAKLGEKLNVPFENTWSCYNGRELHCGKCGTCVERIEAFEDAEIKDKTKYEI